MQQVPYHHRTGVDVEHLAHTELGVVFQVLVNPFYGVVVGLPDAAESDDETEYDPNY